MYLAFHFWITLLFIAILIGVLQLTCAYLTLAERKISAWAQDRIGPNRVGPFGLLQPIIDGIKFLLKEEVIPTRVDKIFYLLAPAISIITATLTFAVVPFGQTTIPPELRDYRRAVLELRTDKDQAAVLAKQARPIWPQTENELREVLVAEERALAAGFTDKTYPQRLKVYNDQTQFVIAPHVDIGVVWVFAISSLAVYAVILGGWSSNNKYSMIGGLRSSAQLISYEIPLGMAVLGFLPVTGSLNLEKIIAYQYENGWNVLFQPLAALLFVTAAFAEGNRLPFDLPECEQELVAGYHTEYGALKFGLFMLGEFTHLITTSGLVAILFFGGWLLPGITSPTDNSPTAMILKVIVLAGKMALYMFFTLLIRWTLPRFRFDQLMGLAWKVLMPLALASLVCVLFVKHYELSHWLLLPLSLAIMIGAARFTIFLPKAPMKIALDVSGPGTPNPLGLSERR